MKMLSQSRVISTTVVLGLAAVLAVLALLQYHWSGQVSQATSARMKAAMQSSMTAFREDLFRELASVCQSLDIPPAAQRESLDQYARAYEAWSRNAVYPSLVKNVYILSDITETKGRSFRLDLHNKKFEPGALAPELGQLAQLLQTTMSGVEYEQGDPSANRRPSRDPQFRPRHRLPNIGLFTWAIDQNVPALVRPIVIHRGRGDRPTRFDPADWLIIQLDPKVLSDHLFQELTERYFKGAEGLDYQLAVLSGAGRVVYSSDPAFGNATPAMADATMHLFGPPSGPPPPPEEAMFLSGAERESGASGYGLSPQHEPRFRFFRLEPIRYPAGENDWQLLVRNRKGSLDAAVAGIRRRNLAVSFGILLVLAATMAIVIAATQRAQRLAQLQMDFVAGVSHELRTPLSVISSAADNLADGVIERKSQVAQYGLVIKKQAQQLNQLIEQILLFAATRQNQLKYHCVPIEVTELIDVALGSTTEVIRGAGVSVERNIEHGLPQVLGDLPALTQCLQNLITNAVKYGGPDRWLGIRAYTAEEDGVRYVRISIDDHGMGVEPSDLSRIFEPFYRVPAVRAAQIHGSGLGLPLARSIAAAMNGRVMATSEPGKGSSFTVQLRTSALLADEAAASAVSSPPSSSQQT